MSLPHIAIAFRDLLLHGKRAQAPDVEFTLPLAEEVALDYGATLMVELDMLDTAETGATGSQEETEPQAAGRVTLKREDRDEVLAAFTIEFPSPTFVDPVRRLWNRVRDRLEEPELRTLAAMVRSQTRSLAPARADGPGLRLVPASRPSVVSELWQRLKARASVRRWVVLGVVLGLPVALLLIVGGVAGPCIARCNDAALVGETYDEYLSSTGRLTVYLPREMPASETQPLIDHADWFLTAEAQLLASYDIHVNWPPRPLTLFLVRSHDDMREIGMKETMQDFVNNGGYFDPRRLTIALEGHDLNGINHELFHALIHLAGNAMNDPAPWLNEGMAQYMERLRASTAQQAKVDTRLPNIPLAQLPSVEALLGVRQEAFAEAGNSRVYGAALMLTTFLMEADDGAHREALFTLLRRQLRGDDPSVQQMLATLGFSAESLETAWHRWLSQQA